MKKIFGLFLVLSGTGFLFYAVSYARITGTNTNDAWCAGAKNNEVCVDSSGNLIPTLDQGASLGSASLRWSDLRVSSMTNSGAQIIAGQAVIQGTATVQGGNFSVAIATFVVAGGSVTIGGPLAIIGVGSNASPQAIDLNGGNIKLARIIPTSDGNSAILFRNAANGSTIFSVDTTNSGIALGTYGGNAAPSNGLIVSGNLGAGIQVPATAIDSGGAIQSGSGVNKSTMSANGQLGPRTATITQIDALTPDFKGAHVTVTNMTSTVFFPNGVSDCISTGTAVAQWAVNGGTHGVNMNGCGSGQ